MASEKDMLVIDFSLVGEKRHGGARVADGFVIDRKLRGVVATLRTVFLCAFRVAEYSDSAAGNSPREILEQFVRANRFVLIVRTGTLNEDDSGKRARALWHCQRSREFVLAVDQGEWLLGKRIRLCVCWGNPG